MQHNKNIFALVPATELANVADRFTRNEILSSNEFRGILGFKPSGDPRANELRNKNLNAPAEKKPVMAAGHEKEQEEAHELNAGDQEEEGENSQNAS